MEKNDDLYIPVNIRRRKEIVDGYGYKELTQTVVTSVIGLVIGVLVFIISDQIAYLVMVPIIFGVIAVAIFRKNKFNQNMVSKIRMLIDYMNSQKKYYYKYHNIYESDLKE